MENHIKNHVRVNETILRPLEKKALEWLAAHMPAWVNPDHLTALGIFASLLICISLILTNFSPAFLWLANLGVLLNWFGDSLDGTLARYRKIERSNYGYYIDHAVDAVSEALVFMGLGLSPYVRVEFAMLALITYLMMSIQVFLYSQVKGVFQISFLRLGPTEVRGIMILSNIFVFYVGNPTFSSLLGSFTLYDLVALFIALLLFSAFIIVTIIHARELAAYDENILRQRAEREARKAERAARKAERAATRRSRRAKPQRFVIPVKFHLPGKG
ncbi:MULTISPECIES: CDP-alcohol phosphatidyltransferase family protein [Anaerolinea]|uniref:CDP-alcohol phosphatidyltransferase family protein n=1 Tax=Anaerolinea TaxID=233189 RepID=UPI00262A348A|nr:CDP-alcohol phosphatidyltransferase family protein [Anaerolinea thermophila]